MNGETLVLSDPEAVALESARRLLDMMETRKGERFSLALSGGSTPQRLYRLLASPPWREQIDWNLLHVFLADERFVPHDHPDSNLRMARETLLDHVPIPAANIHPMPADGTVEDSAQRYEAELREFFGESPPHFDALILGMGPDGHTASLFPGHIHPKGPWVLPVHDSPKPPPTRLTLSLELINQARHVLFLVTGKDKSPAIASLRTHEEPVLPAGRVGLDQGELVWLLDEAAWAVEA